MEKNRPPRKAAYAIARICGLIMLMTLLAPEARATHIVGGDLGYEFLGETAPGTNMFRYKLKMRFYLNCGPSSNWPSIIEWIGTETAPVYIGVYAEDPQNPNAAKILYTSGNVFLTSYNIITPDLPDSCQLGEGQCVEESLFEGEVIVPLNAGGYHLYFEGFARNEAIDNLIDPGGTGIGLYSYIPPATIPNSSPAFTGTPVPFVCIGDTTNFSNAAEDIDGDSLAFSFEIPYGAQQEIAGVVNPAGLLDWPVVEVDYQIGFSPTEPFGVGGYAVINSFTGATEYAATIIGNWSVAVECREYRNGVLIGKIRSDMQLLSLPCSNNDPPMPLGGTLVTEYSVNAGDTLCFALPFVDPDGDLVNVSVNGVIFDPNLFSPPAQIIGVTVGDSIVIPTFCWPTVCDQGTTDPYNFSIIAYDDACPPGIYNAVINVDVIPAAEQLVITGPLSACAGQTTGEYCAEAGGGTSFAWNVSGGSITTPSDQQCITVAWTTEGIGVVTVTSAVDDCIFSADQPVNVHPVPVAAFSLELDTNCAGVYFTAQYLGPSGHTMVWTLDGALLSTTNSGSSLVPYSGSGLLELTVTDQYGCYANSEQYFEIAPYGEVVEFSIPNVFTPNNDTYNDRFELITTASLGECLDVTIFDRWGKLVWESKDQTLAWNGKRQGGDPAAEGVYYYIVKVDKEVFHGHVSLMR